MDHAPLLWRVSFAWQLAAAGPEQGEGAWRDRVIQRYRGDKIHSMVMQILKEDETPTISTVPPSTQNLFHVWVYLTGAFVNNKFHLHLRSKVLSSCQGPKTSSRLLVPDPPVQCPGHHFIPRATSPAPVRLQQDLVHSPAQLSHVIGEPVCPVSWIMAWAMRWRVSKFGNYTSFQSRAPT